MSLPEGNPQRVESVIINDETEEPSLLNAATGQILITNSVGKRIIELADGSRNLDSIVDAIVDEYTGAEKLKVSEQTRAFLAESTKKGIVQWTPTP